MNPLYAAALLALLFVGTHIGLATRPVRARLTGALGDWGFRWLFMAVAAISFALVTVYYADHRTDGGVGLALGTSPGWRMVLSAVVVVGVTFIVAGFWVYPGGAYDLDQPGKSRTPRGLERVTRHPFLLGVALFASAHALLATHRIAMVLMLSLAALAVLGAYHQDAKLTRLRGKPFADHLAATSAIPFAAIVSGRNRLVWRELPLAGFAVGLALAAVLRYVHDDIFAHHGAWVILVIVGGGLAIGVTTWLRDHRTVHATHDRTA